MDAEQFFCEVTRELAEIEDANSYFQHLAEQLRQQQIDDEYSDYLQAMLRQVYDEIYDDSFTWA